MRSKQPGEKGGVDKAFHTSSPAAPDHHLDVKDPSPGLGSSNAKTTAASPFHLAEGMMRLRHFLGIDTPVDNEESRTIYETALKHVKERLLSAEVKDAVDNETIEEWEGMIAIFETNSIFILRLMERKAIDVSMQTNPRGDAKHLLEVDARYLAAFIMTALFKFNRKIRVYERTLEHSNFDGELGRSNTPLDNERAIREAKWKKEDVYYEAGTDLLTALRNEAKDLLNNLLESQYADDDLAGVPNTVLMIVVTIVLYYSWGWFWPMFIFA